MQKYTQVKPLIGDVHPIGILKLHDNNLIQAEAKHEKIIRKKIPEKKTIQNAQKTSEKLYQHAKK